MSEAIPAAHTHSGPEAECDICRNRKPFDLPPEVVEACRTGNLVLFAGAGISTESRTVLQNTFYERVASELGLTPDGMPFPDLMSEYVRVRGRRPLLQRIRERLDYVDSFPELRFSATRFHRALGTLFYVGTIITTNWDPYFEQETGALPLVTDADYALADLPGRKVFKIHGSIFNIGSIVVTREDYERCHRALSRNVLGSTLKHLLATKTVLFVGYSFGDSDFNRIYQFMRRQMPDVLPRSYVVTLGNPPDPADISAHTIQTDATFFIERLKEELVEHGCLLPDERWLGIPEALNDILERHHELYEKVDMRRYPAALMCGYYQDGLIHAFERMLERRGSGEYGHVHAIEQRFRTYEVKRKQLVKEKKYHDAAYVIGYQNGLLHLICDDDVRDALPLYFIYGSRQELRSISAMRREAARARRLHKQAYAQAERIGQRWSPDLVIHHRPEV